MNVAVPWNASWSGEERYEVRPCRYAEGKLAVWQPYAPGAGRPLFANPHVVRQRRSIAEMRCTVCGEPTPVADRWWFGLGVVLDGLYTTTEAPVHRACAYHALRVCPHLRAKRIEPAPLPIGHGIIASLVGGEAMARDFEIEDRGRQIIGSLKLTWPISLVMPQVMEMAAHAEARRAAA